MVLSFLVRAGGTMASIREFKRLSDVPKHIQIAFKEDRWKAKYPTNTDTLMWNSVDWINYVCKVGYFHGIDKSKRLKV
jgi:hypothetical protein